MFYQEVLSKVVDSIRINSYKNAFCISEVFYTYKQLSDRISAIRSELQKTDYSNNKIGLAANDDLETYASIIAIWLEGETYVPLNPHWPIERCQDIIQQVGIDLILDSSTHSRFSSSSVQIMYTSPLQYTEDCLECDDTILDSELAYILFTSGSTGKPKGVMLSRLNLASFVDAFWERGIHLSSEDRCLQCFDLTFDLSIQGFLIPLLKGACCYTIPIGQVKYVYISSLIEDHHLTLCFMAPSTLRYLLPYFDELDASSLRYSIMAAEACPVDLMEAWYQCAKNVEIFDFYGPTEATINCTSYKLTRNGPNKSLNGIISIGKPFKDITAIIIDEDGNLLSDGEEGELCLAGGQITKGYWNNSEANAKSFFKKSIDGVIKRFYHTGDLCYKDFEGDIMYSGRKDNQVKIQGFRVEMGEIEFYARTFLKDKNAVCVAFKDDKGLTEIAMFIESDPFDSSEMLCYMRSRMPAYMIPAKVLFLPSFPLNSNDKVDRKELKKLLQ